MAKKSTLLVSAEIERLAKKYGVETTTVSGWAFKNSRQHQKCLTREALDADRLKRLQQLEERLDEERAPIARAG